MNVGPSPFNELRQRAENFSASSLIELKLSLKHSGSLATWLAEALAAKSATKNARDCMVLCRSGWGDV